MLLVKCSADSETNTNFEPVVLLNACIGSVTRFFFFQPLASVACFVEPQLRCVPVLCLCEYSYSYTRYSP